MIKNIIIGICLIISCFFPLQYSYAGINWGNIIGKVAEDTIERNIRIDKNLKKQLYKKTYVAPTTVVHPDGKYNYGVISYLSEDEEHKTAYHKYKIYLSKPTTLKLHFISYVNRKLEIKMVDSDENVIRPFEQRLYNDGEPFTESITLDKGEYTFIVYKIRSFGNCSNTGKYRFKFSTDSCE